MSIYIPEIKMTKDEFEIIERDCVNFITDISQKIHDSIHVLCDKELVNSAIVLLMVYVDFWSRIWFLFNNSSDCKKNTKFIKNKQRFVNWCDEFVFNKNNNEWVRKKDYLVNYNSNLLWDIRNSFLHFYNFPQGWERPFVWGLDSKKMIEELAKKEIMATSFYDLKMVIWEGAVLNFYQLKNLLRSNPICYASTIVNVLYPVIKKERAILINNDLNMNQPEQQKVQIQISDNIAGGEYANGMQVSHNGEEFFLTFVNIVPPSGKVTNKVITSPGHLKRIIAVLSDNLKKFEDQYGQVKTAENVSSEIGFKS